MEHDTFWKIFFSRMLPFSRLPVTRRADPCTRNFGTARLKADAQKNSDDGRKDQTVASCHAMSPEILRERPLRPSLPQTAFSRGRPSRTVFPGTFRACIRSRVGAHATRDSSRFRTPRVFDNRGGILNVEEGDRPACDSGALEMPEPRESPIASVAGRSMGQRCKMMIVRNARTNMLPLLKSSTVTAVVCCESYRVDSAASLVTARDEWPPSPSQCRRR